ncbi:MAG: LysM peptidoglycan-binding domain-containing protein [Cytophagales bacterium]
MKSNETIWMIAQQYGMETDAIIRKNRMKEGEALVQGRKLYLKDYRPIDEPILIELEVEDIPENKANSNNQNEDKNEIIKENITNSNQQSGERNLNEEKKNESEPTTPEQNIKEQNIKPLNHIVIAGESLYKISKTYGLSIDSLVVWNSLNGFSISPGMNLKLANPSSNVESKINKQKTYVVKQGDSLFKIAKEHNLQVNELMRINNKTSPELKVGEELVVTIP